MTTTPTIRSQSDLHDAWRTLMGRLGFSSHRLWVMLIRGDDQPIPQLTQVEDADELPTAEQWEGFAEFLRTIVEGVAPGGRVAVLRSRPGPGGLTAQDRAWARGVYEAGRVAGVPVDVVHRACDADLVPIPMDEVLAEPA